MSDDRKARSDVIADVLGLDENVSFNVLALLFDPGGGLKKREAEGHLVLTDRRLIFGTAKHGILVDLATKELRVPASVTYKWIMAHLVVEADTRTKHTFVLNKGTARDIAGAINTGASP